MSLSSRDKAIIRDLNRFRAMSLDDIAEIHFSHLKRPKNSANNVLKRLFRDGKIKRSTAFQPYVYFGPDVNLKENSAKIGHFLAIVQVYKDILRHGDVETFLVEPKYGQKGMIEPDIFCMFVSEYGKSPFFIEVQNSVYSENTMREKLKRYVALYESGIIHREPWQDSKPVFPYVLILTESRYALDESYPFRVLQAQSFSQFLHILQNRSKPKSQEMDALKFERINETQPKQRMQQRQPHQSAPPKLGGNGVISWKMPQ
jgi:hypothetical protein